MNRTQCAETLIEYATPYDHSFTPQALKIWHKLFSQYEWSDFEKGVKMACLAPGRFRFPKPGEIEAELRKIVPGLTLEPEAGIEIVEQVAKRGLPWKDAQKIFMGNIALRYTVNSGIYERFRYAQIDDELIWVKKDLRQAIKNVNQHMRMEDRDAIAGGAVPLVETLARHLDINDEKSKEPKGQADAPPLPKVQESKRKRPSKKTHVPLLS